jgi:hypothetical protein
VTQREASKKLISDTSTKTVIINLDKDFITIENNKPILTEIGRRVLEHKNKITICIIKQNKGIILIFSRGNLV